MSGSNNGLGESNILNAIKVLQDARKTRRPVIMLLGTGVSVDAGIPVGSQLTEYLVRLSEFIQLGRVDDKILRARDKVQNRAKNIDKWIHEYPSGGFRQHLLDTRWPSRHDLNVDLMVKFRSAQLGPLLDLARPRVNRQMFVSEMRQRHPT